MKTLSQGLRILLSTCVLLSGEAVATCPLDEFLLNNHNITEPSAPCSFFFILDELSPTQSVSQTMTLTLSNTQEALNLKTPTPLGLPEPVNKTAAPALSPIPTVVTASVSTAASVSSAVSIVAVSPGSVTQGSRAITGLNLLTCYQNNAFENEPMEWSKSPIPWNLGTGNVSYARGAVTGNWAIMIGLTGIHLALSREWTPKLSPANLRYPGLLILPALFLMSPTSEAAINIARFGGFGDQILAGFSIGAQVISSGITASLLSSSKFKATWVNKNDQMLADFGYSLKKGRWLDLSDPKNAFVHQYGFFFKDYRKGMQWFMGVEMLMSTGSGLLDGFNVEPSQTCNSLIYAGTAFYGAYSATLIALRPHEALFNKVYFGSTSLLQTSSLSIGSYLRATATPGNYTQTEESLSKAAESIGIGVMICNTIRSVFESFLMVKDVYRYIQKTRSTKTKLAQPLLNVIPTVVATTTAAAATAAVVAGHVALQAQMMRNPLGNAHDI